MTTAVPLKEVCPLRSLLRNLFDVRHHIAARIFVAIFCSLYATALTFSLVFYDMNHRSITTAVKQGAQSMLSHAQAQLDRTHAELDELAVFLLSDRAVSQYLSQDLRPPSLEWFTLYAGTQRLMSTYTVGRLHTIAGIAIIKASGETCSTGTLKLSLWSQNVSTAQDEFVVRPNYPYVVRAVASPHGPRAMLVMQLARDYWAQLFARDPQDGYALALFDADGVLLYADAAYARQDSGIQDEMRAAALAQFATASAAQGATASSHVILTQRDQRTAVTAVACIPPTVFTVSLSTLNRQIVVLLIGLAVISAALGRLLAAGITRNVMVLQKNLEHVGTGQFHELSPLRGKDEIGQLGYTLTEMAQRIALLIEDVNQREQMKRDMELQILRAQVSPHFLYNALNTITGLAALQGAQNIHAYCNALIDLLRTTLQPSDILVSLDRELAYVQSYQAIMQMRNAYGIRLRIEVSPQAQEALIMRMLLQPIVENAFIHGLPPQKADNEIRIDADREGDFLIVRVTDNGSGMTEAQIEAALKQTENRDPLRFSGMGIRNVRERILLQFGAPYGLSIRSKPDHYTTVTLTLPFLQSKENEHAASAIS